MHGHRFKNAAAAVVACGSLLALAACTSSSGGGDGKAAKAAKGATRDADGPAIDGPTIEGTTIEGTLTIADEVAALSPLVPPAARSFGPEGTAGGVHTVRFQQERWENGLRMRTTNAVVDWGGKGRVELVIKLTAGPAADESSGMAEEGSMRMRILGGSMYVYLGDKPSKASGGKHWVQGSEADVAALGGVAAASFNPTRQVSGVTRLPTAEEPVATTFRGMPATHYHATLDGPSLDKLAGKGVSAEEIASLKQALRSQGVTSEVIDVWTTRSRLPLQVTLQETDALGSTITQSTTYSDYGLAVDLQAPPAYDTMVSDEFTGDEDE